MKKALLAVLFFSLFLPDLSAQDTLLLSLEDALAATLKNNREIQIASLDEESALARFRQTNAVFLPHIQASYSALTTNNPLNAFGFKLQQQSIAPSDFNPELLNNPSRAQNFLTKVEWQQPLINMDKLYQRKAVREQLDVYAFKTKRQKEYLTFEVQRAYTQLQLAHQAEATVEDALATIKAIYIDTNNRFEKGFLQKSDVLNVQVQVTATESQLAEAKSNIQNASDHLSLLMGTVPGTIYRADQNENVEVIENFENDIPENRADFKALTAAVAAQDMMINSTRMSYLPSLNAFGEYLINDNEALGFGSDSYLLGAQLSWSLFNGMATRNKQNEMRIERDKMTAQLQYQKEQSEIEFNKARRQLADTRYALRQHEAAVLQASEALRITQNRYRQGLVATNDVLYAQTSLSQQKLNKANAIFQYRTTLAYLQFLTSTPEN